MPKAAYYIIHQAILIKICGHCLYRTRQAVSYYYLLLIFSIPIKTNLCYFSFRYVNWSQYTNAGFGRTTS